MPFPKGTDTQKFVTPKIDDEFCHKDKNLEI